MAGAAVIFRIPRLQVGIQGAVGLVGPGVQLCTRDHAQPQQTLFEQDGEFFAMLNVPVFVQLEASVRFVPVGLVCRGCAGFFGPFRHENFAPDGDDQILQRAAFPRGFGVIRFEHLPARKALEWACLHHVGEDLVVTVAMHGVVLQVHLEVELAASPLGVLGSGNFRAAFARLVCIDARAALEDLRLAGQAQKRGQHESEDDVHGVGERSALGGL